jgi:hypothetical protein
VGFQSIEMGCPERAIGGEPVVERFQRSGTDPVETALGLGPDVDQAGVLEDAQVFRHRRLTQGEMVDQLTDRSLSVTEAIEDGPAARLTEDVQRGKGAHLM